MSAELDLYKILGVERNASDAEIKKVRHGQRRIFVLKSFLFMLYFVSIGSRFFVTVYRNRHYDEYMYFFFCRRQP